MNKPVVILSILLACFVGIFGGLLYRNTKQKVPSQTSLPLMLDIPSIHVHARIEAVGVDKNNAMDIPHNTSDVAWYQLGPEPGAMGNAVIDGHVDTKTGAPAVFAKLKNLKVGDTISVTETQNSKHTFIVTSVESLPTATFPSTRIFGASTKAYLNLITCAGTWDLKTSNYTSRLVVFSKLVK